MVLLVLGSIGSHFINAKTPEIDKHLPEPAPILRQVESPLPKPPSNTENNDYISPKRGDDRREN